MKKLLIFAVAVTASALLFSCSDKGIKPDSTVDVSVEFSENEFDVPDNLDYRDQFDHINPTEKTTEEATEATVTTKAVSDENLPEPDYKSAVYVDVPYLSQEKYPTGCELVSTTMLLSYYGYEMEPMQLIDDGYLKTVPVEYKNGKRYGGNPNEVFVGNPRSSSGYGCYSEAICKALKKYLEDESCVVYTIDDMSLTDICDQYISVGEPVVMWASIDMMPLEKSAGSTWIVGKNGKEFTWLSNEHCMVLVGYDDYYYYIHDPQRGAFTPYKRSDVDKRYEEMGRQAVAVIAW
ncbi:MAG: C39 family peptidase [Ruminococcus sp.]|nr:C39 family peptidase [Ruminococcus sp.]